ncbi:MAG: periplasmic sensor signal transduction histidine kinase [Bryobacterales bacterium]|nr:periplasmic sensor signal transduction histidine kinase [Bryobacterales bacterium]
MHPLLSNVRWLGAYLAVWIPVGWVVGTAANVSGRWPTMGTILWTAPLTLLLALLCLAPFYVCPSRPLRSASWSELAFSHVVPAVGISGGLMLIGRVVAYFLSASYPAMSEYLGSATPVVQAMFSMVYLLSVALHYVALEMKSSEVSEVLAREAQLRALKAQVNPHFLFNSLNSISALTAVDAGQAREMCIRLADFLRTSLRLGERTSIPFGEEMDLTRMYLDVEKVRFGGKLRVSLAVDEACNSVEVPPLLIQPLVENAVKHGVAMMANGGEIRIEARLERETMRVRVANPYDPESPSTGRNGIGLRNIRARLESRFGYAASMEIQAREDWYEVTVTMPAGAKQ